MSTSTWQKITAVTMTWQKLDKLFAKNFFVYFETIVSDNVYNGKVRLGNNVDAGGSTVYNG